MKGEFTYMITSPHFCCGIITYIDVVWIAAPIVKWMVGKNIEEIKRYCEKKNWKLDKIGYSL